MGNFDGEFMAAQGSPLNHHAGLRSTFRAVLWGLVLLAAPFAAVAASAQDSQVVTINPQHATRGATFVVSLHVPPKDPAGAQIFLDSKPICTRVVAPNSFEATIPDFSGGTVDRGMQPCSNEASSASADDHTKGAMAQQTASSAFMGIQFVSLGSHEVSLRADGRPFYGLRKLTVDRPGPDKPLLQAVSPLTVVSGFSPRTITLYGDNFIESPAEDNQVKLNGNLLPVIWDRCPAEPANHESGSGHAAHGQVISAQEIHLCNVTFPDSPKLDLIVFQGDRISLPQTINVQNFPTAIMIWISFGVLLAVVALVVAFAYTGSRYLIDGKPLKAASVLFLDPETNTFSLSKYQFYMWSGAAVFSYSYYALCQVLVQHLRLPDIPSNLPGIIAIGAGTSIGSQVVTSIRGPKGAGQIRPSLSDFVTSGGVAAPDRVQIFAWTSLGAVAFCMATLREAPWYIKELPDLGQGWLYMMGLSSVGYLGGKLARQPGPVLNEMSISSGTPAAGGGIGPATGLTLPIQATSSGKAPATSVSQAAGSSVDLGQPLANARQALRSAQAAASAIPAAKAPAAFTAAQLALTSLSDAIDKASAQPPDLLDRLADKVTASDAAAQSAAVEFGKLVTAGADVASVEAARVLAEQAEVAAAAVQEFSDGVQQSISTTQRTAAIVSSDPPQPGVTNIELRGRNLSASATFEINDDPLPFRMLAPENNIRAPQKISAEPDLAGMARELRLTIAPALMVESDLQAYWKWFGKPGTDMKLAIINPDGQRAEISVKMPPGSGQART